MLMRQLSEPEASSASALSIRRLCDGCASLLAAGGSMDSLMQLYRQVQGSGDVAENSFDLDLDEDDVQQVGGWNGRGGVWVRGVGVGGWHVWLGVCAVCALAQQLGRAALQQCSSALLQPDAAGMEACQLGWAARWALLAVPTANSQVTAVG